MSVIETKIHVLASHTDAFNSHNYNSAKAVRG
jgi:hypothetical protein